jgi:hypothetical protein
MELLLLVASAQPCEYPAGNSIGIANVFGIKALNLFVKALIYLFQQK